MKAVHLLINSYLPEDLRSEDRTYTVKELNELMHQVAAQHPDQFDNVLRKISNTGRKASYLQGETITLQDLATPFDKKALFAQMDDEIKALPKDKDFKKNRREIYQKYNQLMEKLTSENALRNRNNISMSVLSGARGKSAQLKAMITSPGTYSDYKGNPIDVFSRESFAEGITPTTFAASSFGTRSSVISTKCLDYQSLVKMADLSEKKLCDIKVGDTVLGADKEGKVFPVKVLNVFDQGEKECYKYTFRYSNSKIALNDVHVTCTEDHKFLTISSREYHRKRSLHKRGNGPAPTWEDRHNKEIHPASKFNRASRASDYNPLLPQGGLFGTKNEPWARILGLLIGDGCLVGEHARCAFSCADPQLIEEITPEVMALGQKIKKAKSNNFTWHITKADYNPTQNNSIVKGVQGFVAGALLDRNQMLKDYGLLKHYAWEKRFPIGWQAWNEESMKNLIAGLFAADGSVFSTLTGRNDRIQVNITFGMTSEACLKDLHEALMYGFGISSRFENPTIAGGFCSSTEDRVHPLHTLEISRAEDVIKFCEVFSAHVPGIKRAKLIEETSKIIIKNHNPYAKAMFLEKEYAGKVHCMDIEVDHPDHLFVLANGLITSNSSTAKGGDWAKQMAQVAADMVIRKDDCGSHNGLVLDIDDKSLKGRVLARETAGFKPGTLITRDVLAKMRKEKVKDVEARSPLTCGVHNGLCSKCVGRFYNGGKWAKIGQHVGVEASTSTAEPVTQMALCIAGFEYVNRPDGSKIRLRNIEPGQEVCVADKQGHITAAKVLNVFDQGIKTVRTYTFQFVAKPGYPLYKEDRGTIEYVPPVMGTVQVNCTEDHKFLFEGGKVAPIKELYETGKLNGALLMEDQRKAILIEVSAPREEHCYDIEVDHPDHLFVLTTGLICSNSAKHTAGMTQAKKTYSGLGVIQQFTQSPEKFKDEGTVATVDGRVEKIEEAPQGGMYVTIKGKKHYILPGHEVEVKEGQELEAGDQLAEGLVDPEDIVKYKGLGEGRKYWAERLGKILEDSGTPSDKRNLEVLARAAIRHVRVTNQDGMGDYLPDDVVDYNALQASYRPDEETTRLVRPKDAVGKYLQSPVLHYTIGTRITPKVAKFIQEHGHDKISVEDTAPSFTPEMIRLRTASHSNPDWMASMGTSYLTKQLNEAATEGDDTNVRQNADWRPRLAFGEGFGKQISTTGEF